jgi:CelD/BcsL family acetyltransferase involved in cellulose biosynthesis
VTGATPLTAFRETDVTSDRAPVVAAPCPDLSCEVASGVNLAIFTDLGAVETEWRRFERIAACTAFQTFDWLSTWQRHIGGRSGAVPLIVIGTYADGGMAFIWPFAIEAHAGGRRFCWLGQDLCDYTAPLLAHDFSQRITADGFRTLWQEFRRRVALDPRLRHDWIQLQKMPHKVGTQSNPFTYLGVSAHPSGAHLTQLGSDWEKFYLEKRSSATRRHDRAKRRHLSKFGEISFVTGVDVADMRAMVETLLQQKTRWLVRRGAFNVFGRPGYKEFFLDLGANPNASALVHVSRIEIGGVFAAVNFGLMFGDTYYHVVSSYEERKLAPYGPGSLHLRELLAYAINRGLRCFDFTIGDEPYKLEWSDTHLELCDFIAAVTWRGKATGAVAKLRGNLKRFLKQTPAAWRLVCAVRSTLGALRVRPH